MKPTPEKPPIRSTIKPQKTYWHLEKNKKIPTSYDIATSHLLPYATKDFAVNVSVKSWYDRYQKGSLFQCSDWEKFADPRKTSYSSYVELQKQKELYVNKILDIIETSDYDSQLSLEWLQQLEASWPVQRFLFHGLQMVAAYIGQMAPAGRITMTAAFQAADEMRRIQRIAYRMKLLQHTVPTFGVASKTRWESAPQWQPLRQLIEELLVTYDWGEAFIALNIVIKPQLNKLFTLQWAEQARIWGDYNLSHILLSFNEDEQWHQQWSQSLLDTVLQDKPEVQAVVNSWITQWQEKTLSACQPHQLFQ